MSTSSSPRVIIAALLGIACPGCAVDLPAPSSLSTTKAFERRVETFRTSSLDPQEVAQIDLPAGSGSWLVLVSSNVYRSGGPGRSVEVRLMVDGVERAVYEPRTSDPLLGGWLTFDFVQGAGSHSVSITVNARDPAVIAGVDQLQLVAFSLSVDAEQHFADAPAVELMEQPDASRQYLDYHRLEFNPTAAGNYLVLAAVEGWEGPGSATLGLRLNVGGIGWPIKSSVGSRPHFSNTLSNRQCFLWARVARFEGAQASVIIEADPSSDGGSTLQHGRILAIRADAFAAVHEKTAFEELIVLSPGPQKLALDPPLSSRANKAVVLQGLTISGGIATTAHFAGAVESTTDHEGESDEIRAPIGMVDLVDATEATALSNEVAFAEGESKLFVKENYLYLLELR